MKLDYLFQRRPNTSRLEPSLDIPGRALVTVPQNSPYETDETFAAGTYWDPPARRFAVPFNPSAMSPRQFADWAHEMYICHNLSWEEYRVVGFPAELHPDYNRTVGVLTGSRAEPDRPRDMIAEWEERLAFSRRHNAEDGPEVVRTAKVLALLKGESAV